MSMEKDRKKILNIYALFTVSLIMSFVPVASFAFLALAMFLAVLIAAYVIRRGQEKDALVYDHMTYMIRTIWISSLFAFLTIAIASAYILAVYDPSSLNACVMSMMDGVTDISEVDYEILQPCVDNFIAANKTVFINGTIMAAAPVVIYLGYRLAKGISRAIKGHRIGDLKNWF